MGSYDLRTGRILAQIASGQPVTQRKLAKELGIALGLTNLLVRRIVKKGWVKVVNVKPNRVRYLITSTGIAEKARITRAYLNNTVRLYTETRERIRASLNQLSSEWEPADAGAAGGHGGKRIVFYGAGEVAEIGYISLQQTDLRLVGVVDDRRRGHFFGLPIHPPTLLRPNYLNGERFGRLVVMSFRRADQIRTKIEALGFPLDWVYWL